MRGDRRPVLIAALSGRALARAARRAGQPAVVLDVFGDEDTRRGALSCTALPAGRIGFARRPLLAAVAGLRGKVQGLVYGAGFERDPTLLAEIATLIPILGNPADVVAAVKDPFRFAALLARLGLPHPPVRRAAPADRGWLSKAVGGSGGAHIRWARHGRRRAGAYAQQAVPGRGISATFVADGRSAQVLAFTEQWASPTAEAPFRYAGCAGPARLPPALAARIRAACRAIAGAVALVGLNSLDLLVDETEFHVLEVNPRPGASLDVLDGAGGASLWRLHRDAIEGRLPDAPLRARSVCAARVVYAPRRLAIPCDFAWPVWSADRGSSGAVSRRGAPVCTVRATAATTARARAHVERRTLDILKRLAPNRPRGPLVLGEPHGEQTALA